MSIERDDVEAKLAVLEHKLDMAKAEVVNHQIAYRRTKNVLVGIETQLIAAKEEVAQAEEVVRLFKQHKLLTSLDDDLRDKEIKRFRAAAPAALAKIEEQDSKVLAVLQAGKAKLAQEELDNFKKKIDSAFKKQDFAKQLIEEKVHPRNIAGVIPWTRRML